MKPTPFGSALLGRLQNKELLIPYLEASLADENWPDSYTIDVDSSPYTGHRDGKFHPSTHTSPSLGDRRLWLTVHPVYKDRAIRARRTLQESMTLSMGSALHAVIETQFVMAGLCAPDDLEVPSPVPAHNSTGSADAIVRHPNGRTYIVDIKTRNSRSYNLDTGPLPQWEDQVNVYMDAHGIDEAIILVVESGFPYRMREERIRRDPARLRAIYDRWDAILERVKDDDMPEPCCKKGSATMKECPFRRVCWGEDTP